MINQKVTLSDVCAVHATSAGAASCLVLPRGLGSQIHLKKIQSESFLPDGLNALKPLLKLIFCQKVHSGF